jgi:hypothetical protein
MKDPLMRKIVNTQEYQVRIKDINEEDVRLEWKHYNRLLRMGWNGVKVKKKKYLF